jgi:CHAD domain-containing protein
LDQQLAAALHAIDVPAAADPARAVHEARKRLKSVRAALRLVRPALGDALINDENARLRDLGRPLSAVRDAKVMLDTLAELSDHFKQELAKNAFSAVRTALRRRRKTLTQRTLKENGALPASAAGLADARARAARWPLTDLTSKDLLHAVGRTYRHGKRAMKAALDSADDDALHEWRKRAKDLRHQLAILQPLWPAMLAALADESHTLGNHLGADHDLAVLNNLLNQELHNVGSKADRQALAALIQRRRQTLQKKARQLGRRLYAEKPKHFIRRLSAYAAADSD